MCNAKPDVMPKRRVFNPCVAIHDKALCSIYMMSEYPSLQLFIYGILTQFNSPNNFLNANTMHTTYDK